MGGKRGNFQKNLLLKKQVLRQNSWQLGKTCKGASSFQNKLREPCKMYFWFEWEISFIQNFKEISISPSPREASPTQLIYPTTSVPNVVWICVSLQVTCTGPSWGGSSQSLGSINLVLVLTTCISLVINWISVPRSLKLHEWVQDKAEWKWTDRVGECFRSPNHSWEAHRQSRLDPW